jgi:nucleotide-binding universal stress UspA family protein
MTSDKNRRGLVVVGVDGSFQSVAALRWAARYADATGAAMRAVIARHPEADGQPTMSGTAVLDDALARALPGDIAPAVERKVRSGHPAQVLIDESREADLLVVGSSGHGGFTGMLVGSVSIHCVTGAYCPVTVVRGSQPALPGRDTA